MLQGTCATQKGAKMAGASAFGELFKRRRLAAKLTLREFCRRNDLDPGNVSRLERGRAAPPGDEGRLADYAQMLGIPEGTGEWREFIDLGLACAGRVPRDIMSDEDLVAKLPVIFRTCRGEKLTAEQLDDLAETIRKA